MPIVSAANLVRLRTTRHATQLALSVYHPASIWTAQVDGLQTTGDTTITVKTVVQVKAPAANYLVLFGTAAGGSDLGTARWKSYSAPTLTVGAHNVALADNTYITVVEEIKPEARHPNISATDVVTEDGTTAYTNENIQYQPLAKMGSPAVAYIDASTGLATVKFYSRSEAFGGATLSTYAWVFPSGTPGTSATAGTAGTPVTVTWNTAGQYYVSLTVTDSNGKTHTGYRPVFIYDSSTVPYTQIEVGGLEGDAESGVWSTHLTVYGDADVAEFPANALCVLSAIDYYGSEQVSIGNETWRENIVLVGYISRGTARVDRLHGYVEFDIASISGIADNLWQIAGALATTAGTPGGWHTLQNMTYNLAAHHILTQHSTLTQICDVYLNLPTYTVANFDLTDASLSENLKQIAAACRGRVGCNAQGALYLEINPQLQSLASRSVSYVLTLQNADVRDAIDMGDELQKKQTSQIDFQGEDATTAPVFSLAPQYPWESGHSEKVDGIRVASQAEANEFAGLYEAYRNNSFADVVINWRGNYRVFDVFPAEPVAVTLNATQNTRGIVWTAQRCWIKRVSYEYRPGILLASAVVEKDSYGALGVTGNYPSDDPAPTTPPPGTEPAPIPPPIPPTPTPGDGSRVYVATDVGVAISSDFLTTPTWTALNGGLSGDALDVYEFKFDPWSSNGVTLATGFIVCKNGIWKNTGLPAGSWSQVLTSAAVQAATGDAGTVNWGRGLILPIVTQNFIGIWVNQTHGADPYRNYWLYSTDGGTTWSANTTNYLKSNLKPTTQGYFKMWDTWPSHKTAGTIYASMATDVSGGEKDCFYKTTNNGVTWTQLKVAQFTAAGGGGNYGGNTPKSNVMPFANGSGSPYANDDRCWGIHNYGSDIRYTTAFPAYAVFNTDDWTLSFNNAAIHLIFLDMCTWDEDYIYACSQPIETKVVYTNNGGAAWSTHTWAISNSAPYCLSALPYNALFCTVAGPAIAADGYSSVGIELTQDGGATWPDHTGDLKTVLSGIRGIRSIVPDWIKST